MSETWRPIPSAPGYFISNEGRVRGLRGRVIGRSQRVNMHVNGVQRTASISRLMAEAFAGDAPDKTQEARMDPRKTNAAILSEAQVLEIHRRLGEGETGTALAREYGVNESTVSSIRSGKRWGRVTGGAARAPVSREPRPAAPKRKPVSTSLVAAAQALRDMDKPAPRRQAQRPTRTLKEMLSPRAVELLKLAEQRRAEREAAERARAVEIMEGVHRVQEAIQRRQAQLRKGTRLAR